MRDEAFAHPAMYAAAMPSASTMTPTEQRQRVRVCRHTLIEAIYYAIFSPTPPFADDSVIDTLIFADLHRRYPVPLRDAQESRPLSSELFCRREVRTCGKVCATAPAAATHLQQASHADMLAMLTLADYCHAAADALMPLMPLYSVYFQLPLTFSLLSAIFDTPAAITLALRFGENRPSSHRQRTILPHAVATRTCLCARRGAVE